LPSPAIFKKENYDIVAFIGDSSIVNGLSFEALNNLGSRKDKVIIILNDNDMSISRPVGGLGQFLPEDLDRSAL
jgi:1-deoxy-D-xylulose-5-phosphate synthase